LKNSYLKDLIIKKIKEQGAISFADFMEMALYYPELGYYTKKRDPATIPDYYTSVELHPVFGETIAAQISHLANPVLQKSKESFTVIEMGAGKGILACDILNGLRKRNKGLYDRVDFVLIEANRSLLAEAGKILGEHKPKVSFASSAEEFLKESEEDSVTGCIVSNELIDSFPVHRIRKEKGKIKEIYVSWDGAEFKEVFGEISGEEVKEYLNRYGIELKEGCQAEVNLKISDWMEEVSNILKRGFLITIDYGYLADKLYSEIFPDGTLRCYKKHKIDTDPYEDVGMKDITAHVNFSDLAYHGSVNGFKLIDFVTQRDFLIRWGILDYVSKFAVGKDSFTTANFSELEAIKNLLLPDGMGDIFKVMIQRKE